MKRRLTLSEMLIEYRRARDREAQEKANAGKTAYELVKQCEPLNIDAIYNKPTDKTLVEA